MLKSNNLLKHALNILIPIITIYLYKNKFKEEIDFYIDLIPKAYFTIALTLILIYSITNIFTRKKQINYNNIFFIATENDYQNTYKSHVFIGVFSILFFFFTVFSIKNFNINSVLFLLIILSWSIKGTFLCKTSSFKLINELLIFDRENEKITFLVKNIKEFKISPNQITVLYQDNSEKLISFLEIKEKDFRELKSWFQKRLPYITISKC